MTTTAKATTATVKSLMNREDLKVTLTPVEHYGMVTWTVAHKETGHVYGTLESYTGHTNLTPRANTRRDSKAKTLWTIQRSGRGDGIQYASRATALRALTGNH